MVLPLIDSGRCSADNAAQIWIEELKKLVQYSEARDVRQFRLEYEGALTNAAAYLFAHSSPDRQREFLHLLRTAVRVHARFIRQPLASTSNWNRWDSALTASMWAFAFCRWSELYLGTDRMLPAGFVELLALAGDLAGYRPTNSRNSGHGARNELEGFVEEAATLIQAAEMAKRVS